jgi:hypothetical protein
VTGYDHYGRKFKDLQSHPSFLPLEQGVGCSGIGLLSNDAINLATELITRLGV